MTTPAKKHNWMRGFVLPKRTEPADLVRYDSINEQRDRLNKQIKRGKR